MTYRPDPAFAGLFSAFTGGEPSSIGAQLTQQMVTQSADAPLLVSAASDIALFPGAGRAPVLESFRKSTRGFIELTAISHLPLALCYLARMRQLDPGMDLAPAIATLQQHAAAARVANTEAMWREKIALRAFAGSEAQLVAMCNYTLDVSCAYLARAAKAPELLDFDTLRGDYLDAAPETLPVSMNAIMFATFCLAYIDIAYRIGNWLRAQQIDWPRAMVLVSGQSGRPTAGVTWAGNNICQLIWKNSDGALPAEKLYVAAHAPGFSADSPAEQLAGMEAGYRKLWCHTRASVEVSRHAFAGYPAYTFQPEAAQDMPPLAAGDPHSVCMARLRRIMEDPQQLLSNCVADYVVDELKRHGNQPEHVHVPGFSGIDFTTLVAT